MMANNTKNVTIGALAGAFAGFVAGILLAPKSGKETRTDIKNGAQKAIHISEQKLKLAQAELVKLVSTAEQQLKDAGSAAKKEAKDAVTAAKKSRDQAADVLSAVRYGTSTDSDLDEAVKSVVAAAASLKSYIKK